jgi:hypothetical protein
MWTTLAVAAALGSAAAAEGDALKLSNVRLTYGMHGPTRPNANLVPGDSLCIACGIEGVSTDANGKFTYSMELEISDKTGKVIYKTSTKPEEGTISLGGNRVAGVFRIDTGLDDKPGERVAKITFTDQATKKSKVLTQPFTILDKSFSIVQVTTTGDREGRNPTAVPGVGEVLWVNFDVVDFGRNQDKKQPHLKFQMQIFDEQGKPTTAKPFTGEISNNVPEMAPYVNGQFLISLNRPGKFRVELKATCELSKKTAELSFPLTVVAPK